MRKLILGVDSSTKSTGWTLMTTDGELVEYGLIKTDKDATEIEKIMEHKHYFEKLFKEHSISHTICEDQYMGRNVKTLKQLVRVSTIAALITTENNATFDLVYPTSWKKLVNGSGKAKKADTIKYVNETYGTSFKLKDNDIADSISIAEYKVRKLRGE